MDIVQQILGAFAAIQSPYTTNEERYSANDFIENLKGQRDCATYIHLILAHSETLPSDQAELIRYLSLKVYEDWMFGIWNQLGPEEHKQLREAVLHMINSSMFLYEHSRSIKTKLAKIMAEIAKRQYPQLWVSCIDDLMTIWSAGPQGRSEICIMVIEFLVEDCVDSDFNSSLPAQRRNDILTSLKEKQQQLLDFIFKFMSWYLEQICVNPSSTHGHIHIVNSTLRMLCPLASLATAEEVCSECADFSSTIPLLLSIVPLQDQTAKFLSIIISQKLPIELFHRFLVILPGTLISAVNIFTSSDPTSVLTFNRYLAGCAFAMLSTNLELFDDQRLKTKSGLEETIKTYFEMLIKLVNHPSRRLAHDVINDICKIYKDDFITSFHWQADVARHLLSVYSNRILKVIWESESVSTGATDDLTDRNDASSFTEDEIASLDFQDKLEYLDHFGNLRSRVRSFVALIGGKYSKLVTDFLSEKSLWLQNIHGSSVNSINLNEAGGCTYNSAAVIEWDAFTLILDAGTNAIVQALESSVEPLGDSAMSMVSMVVMGHFTVPSELLAVCDSLLSFCGPDPAAPCDPMILLQLLRCIKCLSPLLRLAPSSLIKAYSTLFVCMSYGEGASVFNSPDGDTKAALVFAENASQVRKTAGTVIAHLSSYCSETLVATNLMDQLFSHALDALSRLTNATQRTSMLEALVALSEKVEDVTRRRNIYFQLLDQVVGTLTSSSFNQLFADSKSLLVSIESAQGREFFDTCVDAFTSFVSVARRVGYPRLMPEVWTQGMAFSSEDLSSLSPFTDIWCSVLPAVVTALAALHGLWDPSVRLSFTYHTQPPGYFLQQAYYLTSPSMLAGLYDMSIGGDSAWVMSAKNSSYRHLSDLDADRKNSSSSGSGSSLGLGAVMYHLRYQLYQLIGMSASQKLLYVHFKHDALCAELLQSLPFIDNKHMTQLLKYFIEPYALNSPPHMYRQTSTFMSSVLNSVLERLSIAWSPSSFPMGDLHETMMKATSNGDKTLIIQRFLYKECGIIEMMGYSSEEIDSQRISVYSNTTKHFADLLLAMLCCRGFLSLPSSELKGKGNGELEEAEKMKEEEKMLDDMNDDITVHVASINEAQLSAHRTHLLRLTISDADMRTPFLCSVIALLSIPNSICARKGMVMLDQLIPLTLSYPGLLIPIAREAFTSLLGVLFRQESWSRGLEWDIIGLVEQIYSTVVPESIADLDASQFKHPRLPRDVFLSLGLFPSMLESLEEQLRGLKNKKRKKDTFRDFLMEVGVGVGAGPLKGCGKSDSETKAIVVNIPPLHTRIGQSAIRRYESNAATENLLQSEVIASLFS